MLDNMDGITAGVSLAILLWTILFITSIHSTYFIDYYSLYVISGTMIGFLMLNFYPAKIFMGDKGSQFIGIYLSYISIQYFWNIGHLTNNYSDWFRQGLVPLLIFLVPILDTTFVTINRLSRGTSPAVGGKDHTTHHWFYFGLSQRQIAIFYFLLTCLSGLFAYFLVFLSYSNQTLYSMFGTMYVVLIVLIFLWGYQSGAKKLKHQ
jgi:UDP-GlcNAc:undecaprenyl-phosphate GlcNAc-1-phosphate transferase